MNEMHMRFSARPENETLARMAVGAMILPLNPTVEQMADVKTAVSEAVTNSIIHGYPTGEGEVAIAAFLDDCGKLTLEIRDHGIGIVDIPQAMQPFYSTDSANERSGMGFTVMQSFMDEVAVQSAPHAGTIVRMEKQISLPQEQPARMA